MFAYIKGSLEEKASNYIVIDVGGIGYKVFMPSNSIQTLGELEDIIKVYTHYHVREDDISLYGFLSNEELKMFELLLQVGGIGAKSAILMLSHMAPSTFALAIISDDVTKLTQIPGIGKKTAQRIILELKDKLKTQQLEETVQEKETVEEGHEVVEEAMAALQILGYHKKEIDKVFEKLDTKDVSVEDLIKQGLSLLAR